MNDVAATPFPTATARVGWTVRKRGTGEIIGWGIRRAEDSDPQYGRPAETYWRIPRGPVPGDDPDQLPDRRRGRESVLTVRYLRSPRTRRGFSRLASCAELIKDLTNNPLGVTELERIPALHRRERRRLPIPAVPQLPRDLQTLKRLQPRIIQRRKQFLGQCFGPAARIKLLTDSRANPLRSARRIPGLAGLPRLEIAQ